MTDEELNKLANMIVGKLMNINNLSMWYETSTSDIFNNIQKQKFKKKEPIDRETELVGELAKLMTQMNMFEEKEEYEKCAEIKKKIDKIQEELDNM
tara:strand:- start:80 stop:367 length:288 start_codon:yes stop_codon:yes gene_type:complete